ncbi:RNA-directed DNA polymerase [Virgibacillus halodenitrificans]|uniref:RNA-directed DNA polymerase n=1 Tax=Virgibacillus halodenitrificans TaxID=1482 RepID=UPI00136982A5|nr:RNA-directed DNA polymerase [Virgibacillus halodenitrificans]
MEAHFSKSRFSLTTPSITEDSIAAKYNMSEKLDRRINNLISKKYILKADITRYYPSIYTHSIPWALHSKEVIKANQKDDRYFGNEIDRLVRNLQDGQTVGIPIGPVASFIIQEIVGTTIDDDFKKEYGEGLVGFRYTDDMEYYFSSLEEAERALSVLNKTLKNYGLDLNNSKTRIVKIPQVLEPEWLYSLRKYEFRRNTKDYKTSIKLQYTDIKEYFSIAFKFKIQSDEKGILNYAVKALRYVVIYKENWDIFESLLLQSILVDPSIIPTVFETIEGYKYRGYPLNYGRITDFLNALIRDNVELRNDFEVSWGLSFAAKLNISMEEDVSKLLLKNDNAIVNILVMVLNSKNLLEGSLDFSYYEALLVEESLYDSNWLFYYECCIHGWLGKDKNSQHIKSDKFFVQLLNNNISFVNPTYSKVLDELINSIISLCMKHYRTDMKTLGAKDVISKVIEKYSFAIEKDLIEDLESRLENKIKKLELEDQKSDVETEKANGTVDEAEENKGKGEETREAKEKDEKSGESEGKKEEAEEIPKEGRSQINKNDWLFHFLTTNINKANDIGAFVIDEKY